MSELPTETLTLLFSNMEGSTRLLQGWDDTWKPAYRFHVQPHALRDFAAMCHYHQTSPQSTFTQQRVSTLPTPCGRITLSDQRLITTRDGERKERVLTDQDYRAVLGSAIWPRSICIGSSPNASPYRYERVLRRT